MPQISIEEMMRDIAEVRDKLSQVEARKQRAIGRKASYEEELSRSFNIDSTRKANTRITALQKKIDDAESEFKRKYKQFIRENPWIETL